MFYYKAFGLNIESTVELGKLTAVDKHNANVLFKNEEANAIIQNPIIIKKHFQAGNQGFSYILADSKFYFDAIESKLFFSYSNKQHFEQYLYGPVMALISAFKQRLPLHASGVLINDKSILIAGNSGAGKSTLLFYLLQKYHGRFLSDDIVILDKKESVLYAYPSFPEIKLWLDAVERFKANILKSVHPEIKKYYVDVRNYFISKPQIPEVIFIIQSSLNSNLKFEKLTGIDKYLLLSKHIYRKNHIEVLFKQNVFVNLTDLVNQAQVYLISRPIVVEQKKWNKFIDDCINKIS